MELDPTVILLSASVDAIESHFHVGGAAPGKAAMMLNAAQNAPVLEFPCSEQLGAIPSRPS